MFRSKLFTPAATQFATETREYEFVKEFDRSLQRGKNRLIYYKHNIKAYQNLSAIKYKILSKNTTQHVTGINRMRA